MNIGAVRNVKRAGKVIRRLARPRDNKDALYSKVLSEAFIGGGSALHGSRQDM